MRRTKDCSGQGLFDGREEMWHPIIRNRASMNEAITRIEGLIEEELINRVRDAILKYAVDASSIGADGGVAEQTAILDSILASVQSEKGIMVDRFMRSITPDVEAVPASRRSSGGESVASGRRNGTLTIRDAAPVATPSSNGGTKTVSAMLLEQPSSNGGTDSFSNAIGAEAGGSRTRNLDKGKGPMVEEYDDWSSDDSDKNYIGRILGWLGESMLS